MPQLRALLAFEKAYGTVNFRGRSEVRYSKCFKKKEANLFIDRSALKLKNFNSNADKKVLCVIEAIFASILKFHTCITE